MTWLITGASGQLGRAMQRKLSHLQIPFVATDSNELDITRPSSVEQLFLKIAPTVVVNCAAWTDVDRAQENQDQAFCINALGPKNLAISAKKIGAKLIHFSTDYVFSGEIETPWSENADRNPLSIYGLSKLNGELFIEDLYSHGTYIVRTAWLYSDSGRNFAKTMISLALADNSQVKVVNDQFGQPTSANDLAQQSVNLVLSESDFGPYHGTNSGQATWFDFAHEIFRLLCEDTSRVIPVSSNEVSWPAKRPKYSVLGHDKWEDTGITKMRDWRLALADEIPKILFAMEQEKSS